MEDVIRQYTIREKPYYRPVGPEIELYEAAYAVRMPMMLKGPTGCGKTRFVEFMSWKLGRPLITLACNEDMTGSDLVGRFLLDASGTRWQDGPLTLAARYGAICYLDEVVEARQDTTVVIHPLTDARRVLPLDKRAELVHAHPNFQLVVSYNPGYQSVLKDLKDSTRQRMVAIEFGQPKSLALKTGWKMIHGLNQDLFCQSILVPLIMDHRILAQVSGHGRDIIKLIPPLVFDQADADRFIEAFDQVLAATHRLPGPIWEVGSRLAKAALR